MTNLDQEKEVTYIINSIKNNGVYAFILKDNATIKGQTLNYSQSSFLTESSNLNK